MKTYTTVKLTEMECGRCGVQFAIPETMRAEKKRDGGEWYCPNGHCRVYTKTVADQLRETEEELQRVKQQKRAVADLLHAEERSHAATRGHLTRTKKRIGNGVCPCCNRHFTNVERHMESKHPDYVIGVA